MRNSDYTDDQVTRWRRYIDKCLLLSWKTVLIIAGVWVLSVVLHKAMYGPFRDYFVAKDSLAANHASAILQDADGNLWFGTWGASRYDGTSWTTFTTKDGLADNHVEAILQDGDGNLWFGTRAGVSRYDGTSWQTFTTKDGLADNEIMSSLQDTDGNLWFGTCGGVSRYDGTSWQTFTTQVGLADNLVFILGTGVIPVYFIISLVYTVIRKMEPDQYLLLSWKTLLIIPAMALSMLLFAVIYYLFEGRFSRTEGDWAVLLPLALPLPVPLYFIISLVYTVIRKVGRLVRDRTS